MKANRYKPQREHALDRPVPNEQDPRGRGSGSKLE
jgi:hypothetical protein